MLEAGLKAPPRSMVYVDGAILREAMKTLRAPWRIP
jgi:hypothetical protein